MANLSPEFVTILMCVAFTAVGFVIGVAAATLFLFKLSTKFTADNE